MSIMKKGTNLALPPHPSPQKKKKKKKRERVREGKKTTKFLIYHFKIVNYDFYLQNHVIQRVDFMILSPIYHLLNFFFKKIDIHKLINHN